MIRKLSLLLLLLILGCKEKEASVETTVETALKNFSLSGTINGAYNDYIFLGYGKHKDSAKVIDGKFKFTGELDLPTQQGWLNLRPGANSLFVYLESSTIELVMDYRQEVDEYGYNMNILDLKDIKGSKTAIIQEKYQNFWRKNEEKDNFDELLNEELIRLFKEHPKHSFSGKILGELASYNRVLKVDELEHLYTLLDTTYQNKFDLEFYNTGIKSLKKYNIGHEFLAFKLPNQNSELISITNYKGKYTLVDFWASWCRPCRQKHPGLIELYSKTDRETFDIISLSIDEDEDDWKKAIQQDALVWENVIDKNGEVSDELGVMAIPHSFLLNQKGEIVGINLTDDEIEKIIVNNKANK
ncbi:thioredoxin-like domain-containing protein [Psychroserpens sp. S379A]|uniref:thioredoxin-like domain-containing protein n=1 Tax=Psychroserpens sp. S379A TaxID=3415137 RepID=UPI003C797D5D